VAAVARDVVVIVVVVAGRLVLQHLAAALAAVAMPLARAGLVAVEVDAQCAHSTAAFLDSALDKARADSCLADWTSLKEARSAGPRPPPCSRAAETRAVVGIL
jgi:hypothetical protein